jgi:hypothetical protein
MRQSCPYLRVSWCSFLIVVIYFPNSGAMIEECTACSSRKGIPSGMFVGLIIRLSPESPIQGSVTFDYQFFFNLLLPPIILASGYELHQVRSGRKLGVVWGESWR